LKRQSALFASTSSKKLRPRGDRVEKPDQRLFQEDLLSTEFRSGAAKGQWGLPGQDLLPDDLAWPKVVLWIGASPRPNGADRFYVLLDAAGYRSVSPTGTFWDLSTKSVLELPKRPKGKPGSRFAKVFRTDWKNGSAFYHPYDRVAAEGHEKWATEQPHLIWTSNHSIVDFLEEFHSLLNCGDYLGI
jgi:hypothetical protein